MKWRKREAEIKRLRKKHRGVRHGELPACATPSSGYPSLSSTGISPIVWRASKSSPLSCEGITVGTPHKQGPMVMFKSELPWAGGRKS